MAEATGVPPSAEKGRGAEHPGAAEGPAVVSGRRHPAKRFSAAPSAASAAAYLQEDSGDGGRAIGDALRDPRNYVGRANGRIAKGADESPAAVSGGETPGSANFNFSIPVLNMPGRGVSTGLALNYNSRLWTKARVYDVYSYPSSCHWQQCSGTVSPTVVWHWEMIYNLDAGWPSPGFNLGFGKLVEGPAYSISAQPGQPFQVLWGSYTLVEPDGTRRVLYSPGGPDSQNYYEAWDGSFITLRFVSPPTQGPRIGIVTYSDGTQVEFATYGNQYEGYSGFTAPEYTGALYPTKIRDRNGNYISISYVNDIHGIDGRMASIQDTMGRNIKFNYDGSRRLVSITAPHADGVNERQLLRLYYEDLHVSGNFLMQSGCYGGICKVRKVEYAPVIRYVYIPGEQSGWRFDYSAYGMIHQIKKLRGMSVSTHAVNEMGAVVSAGQEAATTAYNYPVAPSQLTDVPVFTRRTDDWAGRTAGMNGTAEAPYHTYGGVESQGVSVVTTPEGTTTETRVKRWDPHENGQDPDFWQAGLVQEVAVKQGAKVLSRTVYQWEKNLPPSGAAAPPYNSRKKRVDVTNDAGQTSSSVYGHDAYNNVTSVSERGFDGAELRRTETAYETRPEWIARNLLRLPTSVKVFAGGATSPSSRTDFAYDGGALLGYTGLGMHDPSVGNYRGNPTTVTRFADAAAGLSPVTETKAYDVAGNLVSVTDPRGKLWQSEFSSAYARAYPTKVITPVPAVNGNYSSTQPLQTQLSYNYWTGLITASVDANGLTTSFEHNDPLNRLTKEIRPDGGETSHEYFDAPAQPYVRSRWSLDGSRSADSYRYLDGLGREVRSFLYTGDAEGAWSVVDTYYDLAGRAAGHSSPYRASGVGPAVPAQCHACTTTLYDGLGRMVESMTPDGAKVTTSYSGVFAKVTDQAGRQKLHRVDELGRMTDVWEITAADQWTEAITYGSPQTTLVGYRTAYKYDPLGNLREVKQGQQARHFMFDSLSRLIRARQPEQDTLARLDYHDPVTNNGQWTMGFGYDQNGNLTTRVDARNVETTFGYDNLNRSVSITYANEPLGTPASEFHYDGATLGKGRFWYQVTDGPDGSHRAVEAYDEVGRPRAQSQLFATASDMGGGVYWRNSWWSARYKVTRLYDKAGNVTSQTYPSGHTVAYQYDAAGRPNDHTGAAFSGNLGDGVQRAYASAIRYDAAGRSQQERFGTMLPLYHKRAYNLRGQLYDVRLSTHSMQEDRWNWNRGALVNYYTQQGGWVGGGEGTDNDGGVRLSQHWVPANDQVSSYTWTNQYYEYDSLNRLKWVKEQQNGGPYTGEQHYSYDRWGNREINAPATSGAQIPEPQFDARALPGTNRLYAPGDLDPGRPDHDRRMRYDQAGNLVHDSYTGAGGRSYDGENRMSSAWGHSGIVGGAFLNRYAYDADGKRVRRKLDSGEVWDVYGIDGELLAEYRASAATNMAIKEYGYRAGELLVTVANGDEQRLFRSVHKLYNALGRSPNAAELQQGMATLTAAAAQGQAQLLQAARGLADSLFNSQEYALRGRTDPQFVTDLYWTYLQRAPEASGLQAWVNAIPVYGRPAVRDGFAHSPEFDAIMSRVYGLSASEDQRTELFVYHMFTALGRDPSAAEISARVARVNAAASQGRPQTVAEARAIGRELFQSQAYADRARSDRDYVRDLYIAFLDREPDQSGWDAWTNAVALHGRPLVLSGISDSPEFDNFASRLYREVYWLVRDHLGTPRMLADRSGQLAGVKRRDYLPFGENLPAGTGARGAGYTGDGLRKKFTGYEMDSETDLSFAQARYYSAAHGRFTSVDPYGGSGDPLLPQSWNRYAYCVNNPTTYVDPTGLIWVFDNLTEVYVWVDDKDYVRGNFYFDNQSRFVPQADDEIGPNGTTFVLRELRGRDDTPENRALIGQQVYLGKDGKIHALNPPLSDGMPQEERTRVDENNRRRIAEMIGATFDDSSWAITPNPNISRNDVVNRLYQNGFDWYLDFHWEHWGGMDYEGKVNGTWYHVTVGYESDDRADTRPRHLRPPSFFTAFPQRHFYRPSGWHRLDWLCGPLCK